MSHSGFNPTRVWGAFPNKVVNRQHWPGFGVLDADQDNLDVGKRKSRVCSQDIRRKRSLPEHRELLSHENLLGGP